jgi:hypothetical protein
VPVVNLALLGERFGIQNRVDVRPHADHTVDVNAD